MAFTADYTAPGDGKVYEMTDGTHTVKSDAAATGGAFEVFEVLAPGGPAGPPHAAPWHGVLYVLDGSIAVDVESESRVAETGATVILPAGMPYTFTVIGDAARLLAVTSGDRAGRFFADFASSVPTDRPVSEILPEILGVTARHGVSLTR